MKSQHLLHTAVGDKQREREREIEREIEREREREREGERERERERGVSYVNHISQREIEDIRICFQTEGSVVWKGRGLWTVTWPRAHMMRSGHIHRAILYCIWG